jgi:pimeloyl-ACP methyl ester carboxylesterase
MARLREFPVAIRRLFRTFVATIMLVAAVVVLALSYRAWRQHQNAVALAITTPNGIAEHAFVHINGIDQYITIRGGDRRNPVLLILAGGPGNTLVSLAQVFRPWEKYFTVVQWDQRGAGKTFEQNGEAREGPMTIAQMTSDGVTLTEYLCSHLHKSKIVVLGDSWGTTLGVHMVRARPELFSAYVGTGQVVGKEEKEAYLYAAILKKVRAAHDDASLAELERIGAPPYKSQQDLLVERDVSQRYDIDSEKNLRSAMTPVVLFAPDFTLFDIYTMQRYDNFASNAMYKELIGFDVRKLGPDYAVPMFVFNGDKDAVTPIIFAKAWFDTIRAPKKEFVILKGGGHSAMLTMPDVFLHELVTRVRPISN